jgi:hypothetical protein
VFERPQHGTTVNGGANGVGTVFEIAKTASGYASTPTTLVSLGGASGANPFGNLIADANGNLFGTAITGGANGVGTVFEVTGSGFAVTPFVGTPETRIAIAKAANEYGDLNAAALALGYPSAKALKQALSTQRHGNSCSRGHKNCSHG